MCQSLFIQQLDSLVEQHLSPEIPETLKDTEAVEYFNNRMSEFYMRSNLLITQAKRAVRNFDRDYGQQRFMPFSVAIASSPIKNSYTLPETLVETATTNLADFIGNKVVPWFPSVGNIMVAYPFENSFGCDNINDTTRRLRNILRTLYREFGPASSHVTQPTNIPDYALTISVSKSAKRVTLFWRNHSNKKT